MTTTKKSLLTSGISLFVSAALLVGTTFAWFTDSVVNTGNVITAGNLSIDAMAYDLDMDNTSGTAYQIDGVNHDKSFYFEAVGQSLKAENCPPIIDDKLWEPGKSNAKLLEVTNKGNLAAKIKLAFDVTDGGLMDALWFDFVQVEGGNAIGTFTKRPMSELAALAEKLEFKLAPEGGSISFILVYGMKEEAGNEYMNATFMADVTIMATQAASESDGFGNNQYDAGATGSPDQDWTAGGTTTVTKPADGWTDVKAAVPLGSVDIPQEAIDPDTNKILVSIKQRDTADGNVSVSAGESAITYDVEVTGLKADNTASVTVKLSVPKGLTGVQLYHNSTAINDFTYDSASGVLTFKTASFSPFTVVFESVQVMNLQQLKNALSVGGSIALGADITTDQPLIVPEGKTVTLNLGEYDLVGTNPGVLIENHGIMTINGTANSCVYTTEVSAQGRHALVNYGEMTVNGGVYGDKNTDVADSNDVQRGNAVRNYGIMTINSGVFTCCDNYTNSGYAYAIANGSSSYPNAKLTIYNAIAYGSVNGLIAADGGKIVIHDGSYTLGDGTETNLWRVIYTSGTGVVEVNGGEFTRNVNNNIAFFGADGAAGFEGIIINDGTFTDLMHDDIQVDCASYTVINGGTFSGELRGNSVKDNRYTWVSTIAEMNTAIADAADGEIIKLKNDLTVTDYDTRLIWDNGSENFDMNSLKHVTIDLNGKTVYNTYDSLSYSNTIQWGGSSTLTLKNGTIDAGVGAGSLLIKQDAKLIMEDVMINSQAYNRAAVKFTTGNNDNVMRNVTINANNGACLEVNDATVALYDCNFTQTGTHSNTSDWYHACITTSGMAGSFVGNVNIYSGTYTGKYAVYILSSGGTVNIHGGTLNGELKNGAEAVGGAINDYRTQ